jgi:tellurite resistance protein TerC
VSETLFWVLFNIFIAAMLALDLGYFHRHSRRPSLLQSLVWSAVWIALAVAFASILYLSQGRAAALEFSAGYIIELSLSADNLFIFFLIFRYFQLPDIEQYRVLFWGIIGAIAMRALFIFIGVGLLRHFRWVIYAFGLLLIYTAIRFLLSRQTKIDPRKNPVLRLARRLIPMTADYAGDKFLVRRGRILATPLLLVLLAIETTDLIFAVDSITAVLAITLNVFIVYTSNVFAILGLRSLFFAVSSLMEVFEYLHYGIAAVLLFVGVKMLTARFHPIRTETSLEVIAGILLLTVLVSVIHREGPRRSGKQVDPL